MINEIPNHISTPLTIQASSQTPTRSLSLKVSKLTNKLLMKNIELPEPIPEDPLENLDSPITPDSNIHEEEGVLKVVKYDQFDTVQGIETSSTQITNCRLVQNASLTSIISSSERSPSLQSRNSSIVSESSFDAQNQSLSSANTSTHLTEQSRRGSELDTITHMKEELLPPLIIGTPVTFPDGETYIREAQPTVENPSILETGADTIKEATIYVDPLLLSPSNSSSTSITDKTSIPTSRSNVHLREQTSDNSPSTNYDLADAMAASILERVNQDNENDLDNSQAATMTVDDWKI